MLAGRPALSLNCSALLLGRFRRLLHIVYSVCNNASVRLPCSPLFGLFRSHPPLSQCYTHLPQVRIHTYIGGHAAGSFRKNTYIVYTDICRYYTALTCISPVHMYIHGCPALQPFAFVLPGDHWRWRAGYHQERIRRRAKEETRRQEKRQQSRHRLGSQVRHVCPSAQIYKYSSTTLHNATTAKRTCKEKTVANKQRKQGTNRAGTGRATTTANSGDGGFR